MTRTDLGFIAAAMLAVLAFGAGLLFGAKIAENSVRSSTFDVPTIQNPKSKIPQGGFHV